MRMVFRLICLLLGVFFVGWPMRFIAGDSWASFVPSVEFLLVLVPSFLVVSFAFSPMEVLKAFRDAFLGNQKDVAAGRSALVFRALEKSTLYLGVAFALLGIIFMLQSLEDPTKIGKGLGAALIAIYHTALLNGILYKPCENALESRSRST